MLETELQTLWLSQLWSSFLCTCGHVPSVQIALSQKLKVLNLFFNRICIIYEFEVLLFLDQSFFRCLRSLILQIQDGHLPVTLCLVVPLNGFIIFCLTSVLFTHLRCDKRVVVNVLNLFLIYVKCRITLKAAPFLFDTDCGTCLTCDACHVRHAWHSTDIWHYASRASLPLNFLLLHGQAVFAGVNMHVQVHILAILDAIEVLIVQLPWACRCIELLHLRNLWLRYYFLLGGLTGFLAQFVANSALLVPLLPCLFVHVWLVLKHVLGRAYQRPTQFFAIFVTDLSHHLCLNWFYL